MARTPLASTTVREALDSAVIALTAAGCETPRLDAEVLLAHVLGTGRAALFADPGRGLTPAQARAFMDAARRAPGARARGLHHGLEGLPRCSTSPSTAAC